MAAVPMSEWVLQILLSWGAVYTAMFLPAVLMLANFVFGSCFISKAITQRQGGGAAGNHTLPRLVGRSAIALILVSFGWQYYVYMFLARPSMGRREVWECNPLYFAWNVADSLPSLASLRVWDLFMCTWDEVMYLTTFGSFLVTYLICVFSVPQVHVSSQNAECSFCRKCGSSVLGMDHHCYLIGNCVGRLNRTLFTACLFLGVCNLWFLLWWCGKWAFVEGGPVTLLGLLLCIVFSAVVAALLGFQGFLRATGDTTLSFLKRRRAAGQKQDQ